MTTEEEMSHTPGDWYARQNLDAFWYVRKDIKDSSHAVAFLYDWGDETEANAKLIAAAPELLEALVALLKEHDTQMDAEGYAETEVMKRARAAIQKVS